MKIKRTYIYAGILTLLFVTIPTVALLLSRGSDEKDSTFSDKYRHYDNEFSLGEIGSYEQFAVVDLWVKDVELSNYGSILTFSLEEVSSDEESSEVPDFILPINTDNTDNNMSIVQENTEENTLTVEARGNVNFMYRDNNQGKVPAVELSRMIVVGSRVTISVAYIPNDSSISNDALKEYFSDNNSNTNFSGGLSISSGDMGDFGTKTVSKEEIERLLDSNSVKLPSDTFILTGIFAY